MSDRREIKAIAVIGGGTMGTGIAALCAQAGYPVTLLDISKEAADQSVAQMLAGRNPALEDRTRAANISTGSIDENLSLLQHCDWICEAVVEDLNIKRALFNKINGIRKPGSILSTNTSGIPLQAITADMADDLQRDIAVTHFFNPVKVMRLLELVPGSRTDEQVISTLAAFCRNELGKGVVYAKDTVNFIGNRIGCFWILLGLHLGKIARQEGISIEMIDAMLAGPVGLPPTGLYGLVDLIGLDVMDLVAKNLAANLDPQDEGMEYASLPDEETQLLEKGQLGRKTGGGYYRVRKSENGDKIKEVYDIENQQWRTAQPVELQGDHKSLDSLMFCEDDAGRFVWNVMIGTCCYAANLIPEISDDIVNIDRAIKWGFNWPFGPFEFMDKIGPNRIVEELIQMDRPLPTMLQHLVNKGNDSFYQNDGGLYFGLDGAYHPVPEA